jgi:hypothetical protein
VGGGADGLAQRTIRHYVQLAESLAPEVRDAIRRTPIANDGRELQQLASLEPQSATRRRRANREP